MCTGLTPAKPELSQWSLRLAEMLREELFDFFRSDAIRNTPHALLRK